MVKKYKLIYNQLYGQKSLTVYIFIDASNVWNAIKSVRMFIGYAKFKEYFKENLNATDVEVFYYDAYPRVGTRDYDLDGKHKFYTCLKKRLGFIVRKKELKRISTIGESGEMIIEKGNMDVEITIDAIHNLNKYDIAILFSGDADFLALVNYLKNKGKKVFIYSTEGNVSHELKTSGNSYVDLKNISEFCGKDLKHRAGSKNKNRPH